MTAQGTLFPGALACLAQHRKPFYLVPAQATVQHRRDCRQQVADRVLHATDVRLLHRVAIGCQAPRQLGLGECAAGFLLVELARFLHAQGALDEGQATAQLVFCQVARQGDDLAPFRPGAEQAGDAEESFLLGLGPQLAKNGQSRIAAVSNDEVFFARPACDRRWSIQSPLADGRLDFLVSRIALDAGVVVIRVQLVQRHVHRRIGDRIAQRRGSGTSSLEPGGEQFIRHVTRSHFSHAHLPSPRRGGRNGPRDRRGGSEPGH